MGDTGNIQGPKLADLFKQMIRKGIIISMQVVGTGFERLTTITGILTDQKSDFLLIAKPEGFNKAVNQSRWHLRFNFNGPDRLEYLFDTEGGYNTGAELKIPFPQYVQRLQRRQNFRINAPVGSRLMFAVDELQGVLKLVNISLGGAFGVLFKHNAKGVKGPLLQKDQALDNLVITFPADKDMDKQLIMIGKAEVRRIERDFKRKLYRYAFEFIQIEAEEQKKLVQTIYQLQRQYLQRR